MEDNVTPPSASSPPPPPPPPPPLNPPPVIVAPQPSAPRKSGRGWMVFALVLLVLLFLSGLYNVGNFFTSTLFHGKAPHARSVGPKIEEVITEDNDASDKIAVGDIDGLITSRVMDQAAYSLVALIKAQLNHPHADHNPPAVRLKTTSPAGPLPAP